MRIELPDINILLAMTDPMHLHHEVAGQWFARASHQGWATCPLTENGFVRILASLAYPGGRWHPPDTIALLETLLRNYATTHHFWPDNVSLSDRSLFRPEAIVGHRQIADIHLGL